MKNSTGIAPLATAGGVCSAALAALLTVRQFVPTWAERLAARWQPVTHEISSSWAGGFHLGQFMAYLICLATAAVGALVWILLWHWIVARTSLRAGIIMSAIAAFGVTTWACFISSLLGALVAPVLAASTLLSADTTSSPRWPASSTWSLA